MTVADQPGMGTKHKGRGMVAAPSISQGRPERAILPPEPRVELPAGPGRPRWLELFEQRPEMGAVKNGHRRKPGADVVDWLIMDALEQKGNPVAAAPVARAASGAGPALPGGDPIDELVADHLERTTAASRESGAEQGDAHSERMLQKEIEALLSGTELAGSAGDTAGPVNADKQLLQEIAAVTATTNELAAEVAAAAPLPAAAPPHTPSPAENEADAAAAASEAMAGLTQAELDVLLPGGTGLQENVAAPPLEEAAGPDAVTNESAPPIEPAEYAPAIPAAPAATPHSAIIDEEMASKLNEAEGVLAEELAQLMAETHAAEKEPAPVAEKSLSEAAPEPNAAEAAIAPSLEAAKVEAESSAASSKSESGVAKAAEPAAPAQQATVPAGAEAVAGTAHEAEQAASPLPPGVPPHPVVILLPDEEPLPEEDKPGVGKKIARVFSDVGLMVAQIVDLPFGWMDVMNKNLVGLAAFLFLVSGAALMGVAWWMGRH
ncbi:MAG TPA: hypothetical protein VM008_19640, partial [Phycisphaerae bacterium]|nr:hypothetical protein [Phycisphaerae bacterium]